MREALPAASDTLRAPAPDATASNSAMTHSVLIDGPGVPPSSPPLRHLMSQRWAIVHGPLPILGCGVETKPKLPKGDRSLLSRSTPASQTDIQLTPLVRIFSWKAVLRDDIQDVGHVNSSRKL